MNSYVALHHLHVSCVVLSIALFCLRCGHSLLTGQKKLHGWLYWSPHIIDTLLLLSAAGLCIQLQQYPFVHHWLTAKVIALVLYIGCGAMAMRIQLAQPIRIMAATAALCVVGYMIGVARFHHPWSWWLLS